MSISNISELAYELYIIDWKKTHNIDSKMETDTFKDYYKSLVDFDNEYTFENYLEEFGYLGNMIYACYHEFMESEYLDEEYMSILLGSEELIDEYKKDVRYRSRYFHESLFSSMLEFLNFSLIKHEDKFTREEEGKWSLKDNIDYDNKAVGFVRFKNCEEVLHFLKPYIEDSIIFEIKEYAATNSISITGLTMEKLIEKKQDFPSRYLFHFDYLDLICNHVKDIELDRCKYETGKCERFRYEGKATVLYNGVWIIVSESSEQHMHEFGFYDDTGKFIDTDFFADKEAALRSKYMELNEGDFTIRDLTEEWEIREALRIIKNIIEIDASKGTSACLIDMSKYKCYSPGDFISVPFKFKGKEWIYKSQNKEDWIEEIKLNLAKKICDVERNADLKNKQILERNKQRKAR